MNVSDYIIPVYICIEKENRNSKGRKNGDLIRKITQSSLQSKNEAES